MLDGSDDVGGLGVQDMARQLGVSEQTLRRWIWRGKVKATKSQTGRSYRWLVSADAGALQSVERSARVQTLDPTSQDYADDLQPGELPYATQQTASRHGRLVEIEEQIEREIRRLNAQSAALQVEIQRLNDTLGMLRTDAEADAEKA